MPIVHDPYIDTQKRATLFFDSQRIGTMPEQTTPGFGSTFAAAGRTQNVIGSFVTNRVSRMMAGQSMVTGDAIDIEREFFNPAEKMDKQFFERNPFAASEHAYEILVNARSDGEFQTLLEIVRQNAEDYETLATGNGAIAASLLVNLADPTNLIPYGAAWKIAKGASKAKLAFNIIRGGTIAALGNVAQEEALRAINPNQPVSRLEADAVAAGFGFMIGSAISFLASPNFKAVRKYPSMGADDAMKLTPNSKLARIRDKVMRVFDTADKTTGEKPRNFVSALEDSEITLRELLEDAPREDVELAVLHRKEDINKSIPADKNGKLLKQLEDKYAKAGYKINLVEHPLQQQLDSMTALERSLNDAAISVLDLQSLETGAGPATTKQTASGGAEEKLQAGTTLIAKALAILTPQGKFQNSIIDLTSLYNRLFFHDGTISRGAIDNPDYRGVPPAEELKRLYQVNLAVATSQIRNAYDPSREIGMIFGRDASDNVKITTGDKIKAKLNRPDITYTNAAGETVTIPGRGHYNRFAEAAVQLLREQKAFDDGFLDANKQVIPPPLQKAMDAIREFNKTMLDLADEAGFLPGPKTLEKARVDLEEAATALEEARAKLEEANQAAIDAGEAPIIDDVKTTFTTIPTKWHGRTLYEWRGGRLVTEGNVKVKTEGRRAQTWDRAWGSQLQRIDTGNPGLLAKIKQVTDELFTVKQRRGKFWTTKYYMAPPEAIRQAEALKAESKAHKAARAVERAEAHYYKALDRLDFVEKFNADARNYFTRRAVTENIRANREGFKAMAKRSWWKARNIGFDSETGQPIGISESEIPIETALRDRMKIGDDIVTEGDLIARDTEMGTEIHKEYLRQLENYFEESSQKLWEHMTDADNLHGIDHAFSKPAPLKGRNLVLDESDPAMREFYDYDPERSLSAYFHTVGGMIATRMTLKRAKGLLARAGVFLDEELNPGDALKQLNNRYSELHTVLAELDRQNGSKMAVPVRRDWDRVMRNMTRKVENIEGRGLADPTAGANALWAWGGRQLMNMNYLSLLGSQTLAAINDVASLTIFAEISSIPQNVKMLVKAMAPLTGAAKRDLQLMALGFEGELSRVMSVADIDFDNPMSGVGQGMTRKLTAGVGAATHNINAAFAELSLINSWNRYIKRAAAMISMDRLIRHSKKLIDAHELMQTGVPFATAIHEAGLSTFDAARLKEIGVDVNVAMKMLELIQKYGTDEKGNPLSDLGDGFWKYKGIMLPNAGEWIKGSPGNRAIYDLYLTAINSQVEKAIAITPGITDKPLLNDHWWGRAVNQFQTFNMAWANQVARPLAQRPAGRQLAAVAAYFGTGAIIDAIRNDLAQRRTLAETANLWATNPMGMTYAVVNTSGLSGWFNRPMAFFDKAGFGLGPMLNNNDIARSAYQARSIWGSLSPSADFIDRTIYGGLGWASKNGMQLQHWHALRKSIPFQNLIWFRANARFTGIDPLLTESLMRQQRQAAGKERPPEP